MKTEKALARSLGSSGPARLLEERLIFRVNFEDVLFEPEAQQFDNLLDGFRALVTQARLVQLFELFRYGAVVLYMLIKIGITVFSSNFSSRRK